MFLKGWVSYKVMAVTDHLGTATNFGHFNVHVITGLNAGPRYDMVNSGQMWLIVVNSVRKW